MNFNTIIIFFITANLKIVKKFYSTVICQLNSSYIYIHQFIVTLNATKHLLLRDVKRLVLVITYIVTAIYSCSVTCLKKQLLQVLRSDDLPIVENLLEKSYRMLTLETFSMNFKTTFMNVKET